MIVLIGSFSLAYPVEFWIAATALLGLMAEAFQSYPRKSWTIPALLVYATIGSWYLGNLVKDGPDVFRSLYGEALVRTALLQVILFLVAYRGWVRWMVPNTNDPAAGIAVASRLDPRVLNQFFRMLFFAWLVLFAVGMVLAGGDLLATLWPPTASVKVGMFSRPGVGGGADFLISTAGYVYLLICALFAVILVLAKGTQRWLALLMVLITWPYFWFDRTRNTMLATLLPAMFCYWVATRSAWWMKLAVSILLFGLVSLWFKQVMVYRGAGEYSMEALTMGSNPITGEEETESQQFSGLDMLGELCYMDYFVQTGAYQPNWGQRYFAEIANVVPRTIWANKPLIGYDYAYARGFQNETSAEEAVYATVATGMIGQGVANFGRIFGVLAAAFLMALWTKLLAHQWRRRFELLRFLLFVVGCGLTFNMGRDITLLVLWPFVFGFGFVLLIEKLQRRSVVARAQRLRPSHARPAEPTGMALRPRL